MRDVSDSAKAPLRDIRSNPFDSRVGLLQSFWAEPQREMPAGKIHKSFRDYSMFDEEQIMRGKVHVFDQFHQ